MVLGRYTDGEGVFYSWEIFLEIFYFWRLMVSGTRMGRG